MDSINFKNVTKKWEKTGGDWNLVTQWRLPCATIPQIHDEDYKIIDDIFRFYGVGKNRFLRNIPPYFDVPLHPRDIGYQKYYFYAGGWGYIRIKDYDDQRRISELKWMSWEAEVPSYWDYWRGPPPYHGPSSTLGFTGLEFLNLDCRSIECFPSSIENLTNLKELSLISIDNRHLPLDLGKLINLKLLKLDALSRTGIEEVPESIVQLSNLEELHLLTGNLRRLPNGIQVLCNLRTLCLGHLHPSFLLPEEGLGRSLTNLETLTLIQIRSSQVINDILESITDFTSLKNLNLIERWPSSLSLPDTIGNLASLKTLKINYVFRFEPLPDSIGNLCALTHLDIQCCHSLTSIPNSLGNLVNLEFLNLSGLNISSLPQSIGELRALKHLNVSRCEKLSSLPLCIGNLIQLRTLNLSMSMVETLPISIGNLVNLKDVDLGATQKLKTLPDEIRNLAGLEVLNLHYSAIIKESAIPTVIANLKSLQIMLLDDRYLYDFVRVDALLTILEECPKLGCIGQYLGQFGSCSCGDAACFSHRCLDAFHCHKKVGRPLRVLKAVMYSLVRNKLRSRILYPSSSLSFPPLSLWPLIMERVENAAKFEVYYESPSNDFRNGIYCPLCAPNSYETNLYRGGDMSNCLPQADGIFRLLVDYSERILSHTNWRRGITSDCH